MAEAVHRWRSRCISAAVFLLTAAFVLAKTGRDTMYFQKRGVLDLPYAYLAIAAFALPLALAALGLIRCIGARRARVVAPLLLAVLLAVYAVAARPGGGALMTLFFAFIPLTFGIVFSQTWLLAPDLYRDANAEDLAPVYGAIGASSIAGGVVGGFLARILAGHLVTGIFAWSSAGLVVLAAAVIAQAQMLAPPESAEDPEPLATMRMPAHGELQALARDRTARLLLLAAMAGAVAGLLVEFQFYLAASGMMSGPAAEAASGARFFANAYLALNLAAFAVQLAVFPALERRVGIAGTLLVLPLALLGGAGALAASATAFLRTLLRVTEGGLKASIHRASWEQAFLAVPRATRALAKVMVDGVGARLAEGATAGTMIGLIALRHGDEHALAADVGVLTWGLLAAAGAWALVTYRVGPRLKSGPLPAPPQLPEACCFTATLAGPELEKDKGGHDEIR
jgi:AAA family ATP:ADP antiporter